MEVSRMDKLAIHGGTPIRTREWVSKYMGSEELGAEEKERVLRVLEKKRVFRYFPEGLEESETALLEEEYKRFFGSGLRLGCQFGHVCPDQRVDCCWCGTW